MEPVTYFHSHIQVISRGKGKSAVVAAAYRAGETIKNDYDGIIHDYTRKGGIVHAEILLPEHAPRDYYDRSILWNAVEKIEKAANSQLARELDIALPAVFTHEQNISLARRYVQETFVNAGMCADLCVHDKGDGNPHMHIMLTMRPINGDGTWGDKQKKEYTLDSYGNKIYDPKKRQYKCRSIPSTDWNNQAKADEWRMAWENMANAELERHGFEGRLDRRSYEEQGIEKIPTVHLGPAASQMEKRGIRTERGDKNREIEVTNKQIQQLRARINKLDKWIAEEAANTAPPTLADVIRNILDRRGIYNLKSAASILVFLGNNDITDFADLEKKVRTMRGEVNRIKTDLRTAERRIDTLNAHIAYSEDFKKYRKVAEKRDALYAKYKTLSQQGLFSKGKAQKALEAAEAFADKHFAALLDYDDAEKYLRGVLQKRFDPKKLPLAKWRDELTAKTAERDSLVLEYNSLKAETQKVEQIRRSVDDIMRAESRERVLHRSNGMEL